ncbi:hypothetical protein SprV_0802519300 [Sparganum proliferum]
MKKAIPGADGWTGLRLVISKKRICLQPRRRPQVAVAVADEDASVENRWCQLRDTVQSTALAVLGRARHQHQDWFDDNDAAIKNLLVKNRLHKTYINRPANDNKAAFNHSRHLVQQQLREMQEAWTTKAPVLFSAPTETPYSLRRHKFYSDGPNTSEASSTVPPPPPTPSSSVCLKWRSTPTSTSCPLSRKPTRPCNCFHVVCHANGRLPRQTPPDPRRLQDVRPTLKSAANTLPAECIHFADDCALNATSDGDMHRSMDLFAASCGNFGRVINTEKTIVMNQPTPDAAYVTPQINVNGVQMQAVDNFTYMSSTLFRNTKIDDEVVRRN